MKVTKAAVVGNGVMGSGLARHIAASGFPVVMYGRNIDKVNKAVSDIENGLARQAAKGKLDEAEVPAIMGRITPTDNMADIAEADIVIEAVAEDLEIKKEIFKKMEEVCRDDAVLATNTSGLSINAIAEAVEHKDRVIGIHFFVPPTAMKLAEITMGDATSEEAYETSRDFCEAIGKVCVRVNKDTPGFIVNRVLFAYYLESIKLIQEGVATPEDVDTAMHFGLNHPIGPFNLMDMGGLDVVESVFESLQAIDPERFATPKELHELREAGKLGVKTREGWHKYDERGKKITE